MQNTTSIERLYWKTESNAFFSPQKYLEWYLIFLHISFLLSYKFIFIYVYVCV